MWEEGGTEATSGQVPHSPELYHPLPPAYPQGCLASRRAGPGYSLAPPWSLWILGVWQMGQKVRYHLERAKEEEEDEIGWQKGQALV